MSEENKDQNTQGGEELILGKFKTQDDLIASYKQLEQKLHSKPPQQEPAKPPSPPQDEFEWQKKNAQLDAAESLTAKRKQEAAELLSDADTLKNVRAALGSSERIKEFQDDFDKGNVSAAEVKRLAGLRAKPTEATTTIPENKTDDNPTVTDEEQNFLLSQLKTPYTAYANPSHPKHKEARQRVAEIKAKMGM